MIGEEPAASRVRDRRDGRVSNPPLDRDRVVPLLDTVQERDALYAVLPLDVLRGLTRFVYDIEREEIDVDLFVELGVQITFGPPEVP